jgi:hypothetical protein
MIAIFGNILPSDAAIPAAIQRIVTTLLGGVATGVAVLAVAFLGFGMMFGHLDWRLYPIWSSNDYSGVGCISAGRRSGCAWPSGCRSGTITTSSS